MGHYLFAHSEVANQRWAEASKAFEEAHAEAEKAQAEADALKVAWEIHLFEVECLQKALRREREEMVKLRAKLALEREERKKGTGGA